MYSISMAIVIQYDHYPWWTNIAMENGPFIVDTPIKNGDFP